MTSAQILLAALRQFLAEQVQPELEGFAAYQNRIARNLLQVLEREASLGAARESLDRAFALSAGLDPSQPAVAVARALRDGQCAESGELTRYLRRRALLSLAIDNPKYSGYRDACARWPEFNGLDLETTQEDDRA